MTFSNSPSPGVTLQGGGGSGGGGGGTPGGSDTQIQFNDASAFGGDADFTWNKTTNALTLATDLVLTRRGTGNLRLGAADAGSAVSQLLSVQSVVAGTSNTAGAAFTITGSQGTGSGAGGSIIFQVAPAGAAPTVQNTLVTALTIATSGLVTVAQTLTVSGGVVRTNYINSADDQISWFHGNNTTNGTLAFALGKDNSRFQFGGTTSSFPALKRSATFLQARLADDSAFAGFASANMQAATAYTVATLPGTPGTGMIARVTDALAPTIGTTVASGGAAYALVNYNGANWTVIGV